MYILHLALKIEVRECDASFYFMVVRPAVMLYPVPPQHRTDSFGIGNNLTRKSKVIWDEAASPERCTGICMAFGRSQYCSEFNVTYSAHISLSSNRDGPPNDISVGFRTVYPRTFNNTVVFCTRLRLLYDC